MRCFGESSKARGLVYRDMGEYQLEALEVITTPIYPPNRRNLVLKS
jgi:hypothetical protein